MAPCCGKFASFIPVLIPLFVGGITALVKEPGCGGPRGVGTTIHRGYQACTFYFSFSFFFLFVMSNLSRAIRDSQETVAKDWS
jgi:hypothetical protein